MELKLVDLTVYIPNKECVECQFRGESKGREYCHLFRSLLRVDAGGDFWRLPECIKAGTHVAWHVKAANEYYGRDLS
jgi:hypothetical protein